MIARSGKGRRVEKAAEHLAVCGFVLITLCAPDGLLAQKRGLLDPAAANPAVLTSDANKIKAASVQRGVAMSDSAARVQLMTERFGRDMKTSDVESFARLLVDPSLTSLARASSWGVSVGSTQSGGEVSIQANLADVLGSDSLSALSLGLIGPIDSSNPATDLADLNGLVGTTRAELAWTSNILNAAGKPSLSLRLTGSAPRFEFRPSATAADQSVRKPAFGLEAGVSAKGVRIAGQLSVRYENLYNASDEQSICTPVGSDDGATSCQNVVVGNPIHSETTIGEAELRWQLIRYTASSLNVAYDFKNSVTGVTLPIWVIPDLKGGLGGGIRVGYRSDAKRHFSLAVFVGQFEL